MIITFCWKGKNLGTLALLPRLKIKLIDRNYQIRVDIIYHEPNSIFFKKLNVNIGSLLSRRVFRNIKWNKKKALESVQMRKYAHCNFDDFSWKNSYCNILSEVNFSRGIIICGFSLRDHMVLLINQSPLEICNNLPPSVSVLANHWFFVEFVS